MFRVLGLLVVLLAATTARAAEPVSLHAALRERRAALEKLAGPHPAFDLTYLPRPPRDVQALYAVRPAVLVAHPDLAPYTGAFDAFAGQLLAAVGGTPAGPGVAGIDQLLLCGSMTVTHNPDAADGKTGSFVVGATGFAARAARPFDWDAAVKAWVPRSWPSSHRGAAFRVLKVSFGRLFPGLPFDECEVAFYPAPDGRTLVADSVGAVKDLIDRLEAGTPVTPPPGWDRVETAAVAVAIDNTDKRWVRAMPVDPGPAVPVAAHRLFLAAEQAVIGLDVGPTTRLRGAVYCRDPFQARHARLGRREMMERLSDRLAPGPDDKPGPAWEQITELTDALLKAGTATPTPLGFEYAAAAPGDLLGRLVRGATAAQPPAVPPAARPSAAEPRDPFNRNQPTLSPRTGY